MSVLIVRGNMAFQLVAENSTNFAHNLFAQPDGNSSPLRYHSA